MLVDRVVTLRPVEAQPAPGKRFPMPIPFGWYAIAFADDLAAGQVKPLRYFGRDLVLFRTASGAASLLDAYCPHLGAHLGYGGTVEGECVVCPFHAWRFSAEGRCAGIPYATVVPPRVTADKQAIHAYPIVERNRIIWAWYHPQRTAPTFDVVDLPETRAADWTPIDRYRWTIATTVQEIAENAADTAHFIYVHHMADVQKGDVSVDGPRRYVEYDLRSSDRRLADASAPDRCSHIANHAIGPGQRYTRFSGAFDTLLMTMPVPIDSEHVEFHLAFTHPAKATVPQIRMTKLAIASIVSQTEQDIPIWEHKAYLEHPVLCNGDGPIRQYRRWFQQFYADAHS